MMTTTPSSTNPARKLCPTYSQPLQRVHRTGRQRGLPFSKKFTYPACGLGVLRWLGLLFKLR